MTVNSKLCIETIKATDEVLITGCGFAITITAELTGTGSCRYETISLGGKFITSAGFTSNVSEQEVKGEAVNPIFCPTSGKLDFDLDFYTTGGESTTVS